MSNLPPVLPVRLLRGSLLAVLVTVPLDGCSCGTVASEDDARIAYLGFDQVITKALGLGFAGFNAASSANIPAQEVDGDDSGTLEVTGEVDQGASDNKGMRLDVVLDDYSDGPIDDPDSDDEFAITYATGDDAPLVVQMKLRNIPDGTLEEGTAVGTVTMTGDLEGELELDVTFTGAIEDDGAGGTQRVEGSTQVSGTARSAGGVFAIDTEI